MRTFTATPEQLKSFSEKLCQAVEPDDRQEKLIYFSLAPFGGKRCFINMKSETAKWEHISRFPKREIGDEGSDSFTTYYGILLRQDWYGWRWDSCTESVACFYPQRDRNGELYFLVKVERSENPTHVGIYKDAPQPGTCFYERYLEQLGCREIL